MKYLLFSGSLRTESFNKKLISCVAQVLSQNSNNQISVVDLKTLLLPVYDGDIETVGIPEGVKKLGAFISESQAIIISSPEYNGSIAGSLKNTIDWISRLKPVPLEGKPVLLLGASPGALGTVRALANSRMPFETLGAYLYPQSFGLPKAGEAFGADGSLGDPANQKRLNDLLGKFETYAKKLSV